MWVRTVILAVVVVLAPFVARATDLVVWWQEEFYPGEDDAIREMMADFEKKTGKKVELTFVPQDVLPEKIESGLEAGAPPDFAFGSETGKLVAKWAQENRLVELSAALGPLAELIDKDVLAWFTLPNGSTGQSGLYGLPMDRTTHHIHVWKSLLEQAGFTLADIPQQWEPFWSFWCDKVQPAVRKATGREDVYGVGLAMSREASVDTGVALTQFADALTQDWPGPSLADDPIARTTFIKALSDYTAIYKKGCTPPQSVTWDNTGNNKAFLAQTIVMTINSSLSITSALRSERPTDYVSNVASIDWPNDAFGRLLRLEGGVDGGAVFMAGHHTETALEFVRFLVEDGWLAHWLTFSGDRYIPVLATLNDQPFWLDPSNPHRMRSVMLATTYPQNYWWWGLPFAQRRHETDYSLLLRTAVHRIVTEGISPEQAVDEAIARVKQLLSE